MYSQNVLDEECVWGRLWHADISMERSVSARLWHFPWGCRLGVGGAVCEPGRGSQFLDPETRPPALALRLVTGSPGSLGDPGPWDALLAGPALPGPLFREAPPSALPLPATMADRKSVV